MAEDKLDDVIASLIDEPEDDRHEAPQTEAPVVEGPPVKLTARAAKQVRHIREKEGLDDDLKLRIAVEGGGCSGLSYKLGFDYQTDEDEELQSQGIDIVLNEQHKMYLNGITIDYPDGLDARGFTFSNPNATETCGCGTSFAT